MMSKIVIMKITATYGNGPSSLFLSGRKELVNAFVNPKNSRKTLEGLEYVVIKDEEDETRLYAKDSLGRVIEAE